MCSINVHTRKVSELFENKLHHVHFPMSPSRGFHVFPENNAYCPWVLKTQFNTSGISSVEQAGLKLTESCLPLLLSAGISVSHDAWLGCWSRTSGFFLVLFIFSPVMGEKVWNLCPLHTCFTRAASSSLHVYWLTLFCIMIRQITAPPQVSFVSVDSQILALFNR